MSALNLIMNLQIQPPATCMCTSSSSSSSSTLVKDEWPATVHFGSALLSYTSLLCPQVLAIQFQVYSLHLGLGQTQMVCGCIQSVTVHKNSAYIYCFIQSSVNALHLSCARLAFTELSKWQRVPSMTLNLALRKASSGKFSF